MSIIVEPVIPVPSIITFVSPKLVNISVDAPLLVPSNEAIFEKLVDSSDDDLDEVIRFGSLCSVMIPETFLSTSISDVDIVTNKPDYHIDLSTLHDDETVVAKSKIYQIIIFGISFSKGTQTRKLKNS